MPRQKLKDTIADYKSSCHKLFLKQGSFSMYHSKQIDYFINQAFMIVLEEFFEDFLPTKELVPFCIVARDYYAKNHLCFDEPIPLLFAYKNLKIYHLKPLIKALIELLNDVGLRLDYIILENEGLAYMSEQELLNSLIQMRFISGSKLLFKDSKARVNLTLKKHLNSLALNLFKPCELAFLKQDFNIQKADGGLQDLRNLDNLLTLFKKDSFNYALSFISEKNFSELRLAGEFLLSFKSALNLQNQKDNDEFRLENAQDLANLMYKREKKNLKAKENLVQKILNSMHTISLYNAFLIKQIQNEFLQKKEKQYHFSSFLEALQFLNSLKDEPCELNINLVFTLKEMPFLKEENEKALELFKGFFERKHCFFILKILLDSGKLKELFKPMIRFLSNEESDYCFDVEAFVMLEEFEKANLVLKENALLKLVILFSGVKEENELAKGGVFRAFCAKFKLENKELELGLKLYKNFNALKELVEKEDIYNPLIISALLSKLENLKTLELLTLLTKIKAQISHASPFFYKALDKLLINAKCGFEDANLLEESTRRVKKEQILKRTKAFLDLSPLLQDKITHIKSNLFLIKNSFEDIIKIAQIAHNQDFKFWLNTESNLSLEIICQKDFKIEYFLYALSEFNLIFMSFYELFNDKIYLKFEYENIINQTHKEKLLTLLNTNLNLSHKRKIKKPIIKKDEVKFDLNYSKTYAKLNLNTKDQQGLMAFVMNIFRGYDLHLSTAKIQTIRQRTRNSFIFEKNEALLQNQNKIINSLISE
ncbi:GlnD domain-containing protein [Campylobacter vulpis]|nr:nucleotidyltransferase [Campylobacter vulpis]MBS4306194.1 nucleotidyltransferase [Campylobacter vulpis]MBS4329554.1 nucleotidyltransferase [Campylobacter vulpis]MBS4422930.1 nucleotidyltransferase [Campylobacter vulpis]PHY90553.1 nucleotidyltransferase [Campylobacter vulpis]